MPKKLPDVIECCGHCPYFDKSSGCCLHGESPSSAVYDAFKEIPDWCPLEDV